MNVQEKENMSSVPHECRTLIRKSSRQNKKQRHSWSPRLMLKPHPQRTKDLKSDKVQALLHQIVRILRVIHQTPLVVTHQIAQTRLPVMIVVIVVMNRIPHPVAVAAAQAMAVEKGFLARRENDDTFKGITRKLEQVKRKLFILTVLHAILDDPIPLLNTSLVLYLVHWRHE